MFEPRPKLDVSVLVGDAEIVDEDAAWLRVRMMRWPSTNGEPRCPKCGSGKAYTYAARRVFRCALCEHTFSAVSGTTFAGFKGGYASLLRRLTHDGPINGADTMQAKTALDVRRRKEANNKR